MEKDTAGIPLALNRIVGQSVHWGVEIKKSFLDQMDPNATPDMSLLAICNTLEVLRPLRNRGGVGGVLS